MHAPSTGMRALVVVVVIAVVGVSAALGAQRGPAAETPRATDLLRAERMAEEVEGRRRLPPPARRTPWKQGGAWGTPDHGRVPSDADRARERPRGRGGRR